MEQNGYKNAACKKMKLEMKQFVLDNIDIVKEFFDNKKEDEEDQQDMVQKNIA